MFPLLVSRTKNLVWEWISSSDEPIKYAPNRLGIALIAAGVIGLVLSVYAIYAMGQWQGIWVYIAIFAFFSLASPVCILC
jgi:hypothetical protein